MPLGKTETLSLPERQQHMDWAVKGAVEHAYHHAPAVKERMDRAGLSPSDIQTARDLEKLPVITKDELVSLQKSNPPFGGFVTVPVNKLRKICTSPGPLFEPEAGDPLERAAVVVKGLVAAGFTPGDIVLNTFSYHLVPPAHWIDEAVKVLGGVVVPGGTGNTELQVEIAKELGVNAFVGTPSFLYTLLQKAEDQGYDVRRDFRLRWAFLGAEMYPPSLRRILEDKYGVDTLENYGTADLGVLSYQCTKKAGLHIGEENLVEIVDPAMGRQLGPGEMGEVVVTTFSPTYCLIRFGTGDLSMITDEPCACGRTSPRLVRIAGRVGDAVKVRGMFLHPKEVADALAPFPQVAAFQAVVGRQGQRDSLTLRLELKENISEEEFSGKVSKNIQDRCRVRADMVEFVPPGTISEADKKVKDIRTWE